MQIDYTDLEQGPVVHEFALKLSRDRFDAVQVQKDLMAKFGKLTVSQAGGAIWCDAGYRCDLVPALVEGPQVQVYADTYAVRVIAVRGIRGDQADEAAVMRAVDKLMPKASKAAF